MRAPWRALLRRPVLPVVLVLEVRCIRATEPVAVSRPLRCPACRLLGCPGGEACPTRWR